MSKKDVKRIAELTTLLANRTIICVGDQLLMEKVNKQGEPIGIPIGNFLRKQDDPDTVWFATPTGILLFKCTKLFEFAQNISKETFLENLDKMLGQQMKTLQVLNKGNKA